MSKERVTVRIDAEVHRYAKAMARIRGITMSAFIEERMTERIAAEEGKQVKGITKKVRS